MIHAGEGLDEAARAELDALDALGCLAANTVLIHGVAFCRTEADRVIAAGAGLIWCPSSNQFRGYVKSIPAVISKTATAEAP